MFIGLGKFEMKMIFPSLEKAIFPIKFASIFSLFFLPLLSIQYFLESNKTNFFKTVITPDGSFTIKNVPEGNYHLKTWAHPSLLEVKPVTVEKSEKTLVDFLLTSEN